MLYALLFLPAVLAIAFVLVRRRPVRVLAEAALPPATISGALDPMAELDALLVELEGATVRIDGADEPKQWLCRTAALDAALPRPRESR